jgi:hypothetical protein
MTTFKGSLAMAHTADTNSSPFHVTTQDVAIHMFASVARILLMLGTVILIGEMASGPAKKLLAARAHPRRTVNEDGEPVD